MAKEISKTLMKLFNFIVSNFCLMIYLILRLANHKKKPQITTIVFSFDRPLQLECLLNSINKYQQHSRTVIVVYRTSSQEIFKSYQTVFEGFSKNINLVPLNENKLGFKKTVLHAICMKKSSHYLFYVDDQVLLSNMPESEIVDALWLSDIFTYRLGLNTKYCYTLDKPQSFKIYSLKEQIVTWRTTFEKNDINYVFSLDGTILPAILVKLMFRWMLYKGPNTLESSMNYNKYLAWLLKISAPHHQKCVNFVICRVQEEVANRSGEYDVKYLHTLYMKKYKLRANDEILKLINSPHTENGFIIRK